MSDISKLKRKVVFDKFNGKCAYCGSEINYTAFHIDHIIPKNRGFSKSDFIKYNLIRGTDNIENLFPSCGSCNSSKSSFTLEKWRSEIALKHDRMMKYDGTYRLLMRFSIIEKVKEEVIFYFESL